MADQELKTIEKERYNCTSYNKTKWVDGECIERIIVEFVEYSQGNHTVRSTDTIQGIVSEVGKSGITFASGLTFHHIDETLIKSGDIITVDFNVMDRNCYIENVRLSNGTIYLNDIDGTDRSKLSALFTDSIFMNNTSMENAMSDLGFYAYQQYANYKSNYSSCSTFDTEVLVSIDGTIAKEFFY